MECQTGAQLGASESEQLLLEGVGEDEVTITHDGLRHTVEMDDGVEEGLGDHRGGVWVVEGDEVCVLGEPVHHGQYNRFATDHGESFDEVKHNVVPHARRHDQWLE
jgi:hypothetical protein